MQIIGTIVADNAYSGCINIDTLNIGGEISAIAISALRGLNSLIAINVSMENDSYSSNDEGILYDKSLETLIAFPSRYELDSFTVPETLIHIGDYAFEHNKSLHEIDFGANLVSICEYAFSGIKNLRTITINRVFADDIITIKSTTFLNCPVGLKVYVLRVTVNLYRNDGNWSALDIYSQDSPIDGYLVEDYLTG